MLERFAPDASEVLRLAARCQHIQRWKIPRADYPMTASATSSGANACASSTRELAGDILRDAGTTTR